MSAKRSRARSTSVRLDAKLEDVARRMRCSKCGKKRCTLRAFPRKARGYTALPR